MSVLRQLYPGAPDPIQSAFTRWAAEPLSCGAYRCEDCHMQSLAGQPRSPRLPKVDAYHRTASPAHSYFAVRNPKNIARTLAEPHGRVLFAGEATSEKPATGEAWAAVVLELGV